MITIERQVGQRYTYYDDALGIEFKLKHLHLKHYEGGGHLEIWGRDLTGASQRIYRGLSITESRYVVCPRCVVMSC